MLGGDLSTRVTTQKPGEDLKLDVFQSSTSGYKTSGVSLFTRSPMEDMRGDGCETLMGRFQLHVRGKFLLMRATSHWNNLLRAVVGSPTLDTFKI